MPRIVQSVRAGRTTLASLKRRSSSSASLSCSHYEYFYRYASGRWLQNEQEKLAVRYQRFNVEALKDIVASIGDARSVTRIVKLAEGSYNKVFLLSLDNSKEFIARIRTPHAGPPHLVTASEVATMDFVRNRLGVPIPAVLGWSSQSERTPVEAEYIIMEKASGIEPSAVWPKLSETQRNHVVTKWAMLEKSLMTSVSGGYGSLYYRTDLPSSQTRDIYVRGVREADFVIGPNVSRNFWSDERSTMDIDRGPWENPLSYILAVTNCERNWIAKYARPAEDSGIWDPPIHLRQPHVHLSLLDRYIAVAPYLVPRDPELLRPTLWPHDANLNNFFLSEEKLARGEISITSVIDWEHTSLLPLYLQAYVPTMFRYVGSTPLQPGDTMLPLPNDFETLDEQTQANVKDDIDRVNRQKFYEKCCAQVNPKYYRALSLPTREVTFFPVKFSAGVWSWSFMKLRESLMRVCSHWAKIAGPDVPCPIDFSEEEIKAHHEEIKVYEHLEDSKDGLDRLIGCDDEGWVPNHMYDEAVDRNKQLQEKYVEMTEEDPETVSRRWPYRPT